MPDADPAIRELDTFCRLHLSEREAERLVGWLAWRTGRNQAMAGSGEPMQRLEHAIRHWLDADRRARLLRWMRARAERGEVPVPR